MATSINNIIGSIVNGRFKVLKSLGDGAQGEVFKVKDLQIYFYIKMSWYQVTWVWHEINSKI